MRKFVAAHVLERVISILGSISAALSRLEIEPISIHSIRLLFVFNSPLECFGGFVMFMGAFF